jgi:hypothetical protein
MVLDAWYVRILGPVYTSPPETPHRLLVLIMPLVCWPFQINVTMFDQTTLDIGFIHQGGDPTPLTLWLYQNDTMIILLQDNLEVLNRSDYITEIPPSVIPG